MASSSLNSASPEAAGQHVMCSTFSPQRFGQYPKQATIKWSHKGVRLMSAKYIFAAAFVAITSVLTLSSAHATNGREAVGMCIDLPGCKWRVNKSGSIDIFPPDGSIIACPSATDECHKFGRQKGSRADLARGNTQASR